MTVAYAFLSDNCAEDPLLRIYNIHNVKPGAIILPFRAALIFM
jgi:hypothetical protein